MSVKLLQERCKGCGYCIASCPKEALALSNEVNALGYRKVDHDASKCISCGICYTVCPDYVFTIIKD